MNANATLAKLDTLIHNRDILCHPFYLAWEKGELNHNQLATYSRIYWPHVAAFPAYLESALAAASDPDDRETLKENLNDERSDPKPHTELWLDFAEGLGQRNQDLVEVEPHQSAVQMVDTFRQLAQNTVTGVSALYAYESQQPEVSRQKLDGLRKHYGIENQKTLAYFKVHAKADIEHSLGERQILQRHLERGTSETTVLDAASCALDAYWNLLDGVCDQANIAR